MLFYQIGRSFGTASELFQLLFYLISYIVFLVSFHYFFMLILQWLVSCIIITNKRIIELKYVPFVIDDINHVELNKINEIEKVKHGIIKNFLNYGEVNIIIAGVKDNISFRYVRRPSKFVNLIEAIKLQKPLEKIDLKGIRANFGAKYSYLEK